MARAEIVQEVRREVRHAKWTGAIIAVPAVIGGLALEYLAFKNFQSDNIVEGAVLTLTGLGIGGAFTVLGLEWVDRAQNHLGTLEADLNGTEYTPLKLISE